MQLLIDAGNTNLKWATITSCGQPLIFGGVFSLKLPPEKLQEQFVLSWKGLKPQNIAISHVGDPSFIDIFTLWAQRNWQVDPIFLTAQPEQCGVVNGYQEPHTFGIDRWLALIAGHHFYHTPGEYLCVIDLGTCVTIDVLNPEGVHLGGSIFPGMQLMFDSVAQIFAKRAISIQFESDLTDAIRSKLSVKQLIQSNTSDGLAAGIGVVQFSLIQQLMRELPEQLGGCCRYLLTGGGGDALPKLDRVNFLYRPHLVLEGMALLSPEKSN